MLVQIPPQDTFFIVTNWHRLGNPLASILPTSSNYGKLGYNGWTVVITIFMFFASHTFFQTGWKNWKDGVTFSNQHGIVLGLGECSLLEGHDHPRRERFEGLQESSCGDVQEWAQIWGNFENKSKRTCRFQLILMLCYISIRCHVTIS